MNEPTNPLLPDAGKITEQVKAGVRSHRIKLRVLTGAAFGFGLLAVVMSVFIVAFYAVMYLPKQKQVLLDLEAAAAQVRANGDTAPVEESVKEIKKYLGVEVVLTHVTSMGVTMVALAVGVLGIGMLVLLTVVILNRRVALNQISSSLAQISAQLLELQKARGAPR
jgi:heme exporter protein D